MTLEEHWNLSKVYDTTQNNNANQMSNHYFESQSKVANNDLITQDYYDIGPPSNLNDEDLSISFLIGLSVSLGFIMFVLLFIVVYVAFFGNDEQEYDEEMGLLNALVDVNNNNNNNNDSTGVGGNTNTHNRGLSILNYLRGRRMITLDKNFIVPGKFDDDETLKDREIEFIEGGKFSPFESDSYLRGKEFQELNPPIVKHFNTYNDDFSKTNIEERGIQAFYFLPCLNCSDVDKNGNILPSFIVQDKLDLIFTKNNKSSSTIMNYPLPFNHRDAVYFEIKIFKFPKKNSMFSVGLVTPPYPYFRLPGFNKYSIAYESTGKLRINNPFYADTLLPKLQEGDVVGFGYRYRSGTVFITHNGKKLMDLTHNLKVDMFVSIGCMNAAYTRTYTREGLLEDPDNISLKNSDTSDEEIPPMLQKMHDPFQEDIASDEIEFQVNLGQIGYVFIEANVKKYAFGLPFGSIGVPPSYNTETTKKGTLLQKGDDLPPDYPYEELGFFGDLQVRSSQNVGKFSQISNLKEKNHKLALVNSEPKADTTSNQLIRVESGSCYSTKSASNSPEVATIPEELEHSTSPSADHDADNDNDSNANNTDNDSTGNGNNNNNNNNTDNDDNNNTDNDNNNNNNTDNDDNNNNNNDDKDRKSTRLNSSHTVVSRMPSSA
ncbi:related to Protein SSH4 [Saccharomycodes ludwigii]|uniref:Related to Protein SSH4 n=1 Tax=Saccharomycodes ludwigii TaxID=36035 RepID=A0A376B8B4_9ASCO|nr:related to Protein SSH4 [Saccharomycodes ludwigii]